MRVAIIDNTGVTHHGQVGVALHERGAPIDIHRPFAGTGLPADADAHDALVVFGGEQSALDDARYPYLPDLARLMRAFDASGRPVPGICLGSQILARAWGGANHLGTAPEFGWQAVRLTGAGRADPVPGALPATFPAFQWHSDTFTLPDFTLPDFTLPDAAAHLASADRVPAQAFRVGRASYGTQFHFEANRADVADRTRRFPDLTERMQPGWAADHPGFDADLGPQADAAGLALARARVGRI